jgi:hypothetical protein
MFVRIQESSDKLQVNLTESENSLEKASSPLKAEPFQIIIMPPDAPVEGTNSNLSNFL